MEVLASKWESGIEPPYPNPFLIDDPLNYKRLEHHHRRLDTGWQDWKDQETGAPDEKRQKQAIANAFRAACLATDKKPLEHAAMHYQGIMHLPYDISDPKIYNDALENHRINHNRNAGHPYPELAHKPHYQELRDFYRYYHMMHPHLSPSEAKEEADRQVNNIQYEIEQKFKREGKGFDEDKVIKALQKRLKQFSRENKVSANYLLSGGRAGNYPGYSYSSLVGLSNASRYIDKLRDAAIRDMDEDGEGHSFFKDVQEHKIPGLGPNETALAWYLLNPNNSQLPVIDDTTLEALGYKPEDFSDRDYHLYARQLQAARDAAGYEFLPLAQFQKGLTDSYHGPSDLSVLRAWDPAPYHQTQFPSATGPQEWPEWWTQTQPYRDEVAAQWNANVAPYISADDMPKIAHEYKISKEGKQTYFRIPDAVLNRIESWANYHFPQRFYYGSDKHATLWCATKEDVQTNLSGVKFVAKKLSKHNDLTRLDFEIIEPAQLSKTMNVKSTPDTLSIVVGKATKPLDEIAVPSTVFRANQVRSYIKQPWRTSTVGPSNDWNNPDPMANMPSSPNTNPEPLPSPAFTDHLDRAISGDPAPCPFCQDSGYIVLNGKKTSCPNCGKWDKQVSDTFAINDKALENPRPGELNPDITDKGP
jgi:hypothetical protein